MLPVGTVYKLLSHVAGRGEARDLQWRVEDALAIPVRKDGMYLDHRLP